MGCPEIGRHLEVFLTKKLMYSLVRRTRPLFAFSSIEVSIIRLEPPSLVAFFRAFFCLTYGSLHASESTGLAVV